MNVSIIAAVANNRAIGKQGRLPWHLPADLSRFKEITMGKPILMGRRTYQSIGKALPGRRNIVITNNPHFFAKKVEVFNDLFLALKQISDSYEIMIIGGATLYQQALPLVHRLYLTIIDLDVTQADTFFPDYQASQWQMSFCRKYQPNKSNPYTYQFIVLERQKS